MIHGILVILKIIGILFLVLFLLILAVTFLVLLVPVRYRIKASVLEKQPDVELRVTWLLHLLCVSAAYHPGETPYRLTIRIFGFRLGGGKKKNHSPAPAQVEDGMEGSPETVWEAEPQNRADAAGPDFENGTQDVGPEADRTDGTEASLDADRTDSGTLPEEWQDPQDVQDLEEALARDLYGKETDQSAWEAADTGDGKKPSPVERIRQLLEKIRAGFRRIPVTIQNVRDGAEKLKEKKDGLIAFLEDEDNRTMFRLLKRQTGGVIGHVLPRKFRLYLHFGFPDPCLTGQILGYVSIFYAYYCQTVELVPEFQTDTLILEGDLYAKGRIRAAALLCRGVRLLFDKGCRRMIKKVLKR